MSTSPASTPADDVVDRVATLLGADDSLDATTRDVVHAALLDDETFDRVLDGAPLERPESDTSPQPPSEAGSGLFLTQVSVAGFRGIGPEATLSLYPGPGLTVVSGRNGSGKSSFAEAIEFALTGTGSRWSEKSEALSRAGWRNLHTQGPRTIRVTLSSPHGPAVLTRTWAGDAEDLATHTCTPALTGPEAPSWTRALTVFRPFLPHHELSSAFDRPSALHDAVNSILALDVLTDAIRRLRASDKACKAVAKELRSVTETTLAALDRCPDDRAARAAGPIRAARRRPAAEHLGAVTALVRGSGEHPATDQLRGIAETPPPDLDALRLSAARERAARADLESRQDEAARSAAATADLLELALGGEPAPGAPCPVCDQALPSDWAASARARADALRHTARAYRDAQDAHRAAERELGDLYRGVRSPVGERVDLTSLGLTEEGEAFRTAWRAWQAAPAGRPLADHVEAAGPAVERAHATLIGAAERELDRREHQWERVVPELTAWLDVARRAARIHARDDRNKPALAWMLRAEERLREERLTPLTDATRHHWARLRQGSHVDLRDVRLTGAATRRRLDLDVTIDGQESAALSTMSQGEMNALSLSLFLPRATVDASPFRFVVIDDPVQAMDPSKVQGLADVLLDVAKTRQVVVLTHDDRLSTVLRAMEAEATLMEVVREPGSRVSVRPAVDPVKRHFDDAHALLKDPTLPPPVVARAVPGLARLALETAARMAIRQRGGRLADTEPTGHDDARRTRELVAEALGVRELPRGGIEERTVRFVNSGTHGRAGGADLSALTRSVREAEGCARSLLGAQG